MNLDLTLKKEWFDMVASGEKKEEYRDVKPHWIKRFILRSFSRDEYKLDNPAQMIIQHSEYYSGESRMKKFETVTFRNGYQKDAPTIVKQIESIIIDTGKPEWGATEGQYYFVIKLR